MNVLEIRSLAKRFGKQQVIDGLDLVVPEGSVFGFIGRNGSGKTTTMKMVLGLLRPDAGEIAVCGERVRFGETATNRFIGYLPDVPEFYDYMTAPRYLALCGKILGLSRAEGARRSAELLELVGLSDARKRIGGFSRGMKQRLGVAQALLGEPKLLICDEPTSALDPLGRKELLDILRTISARTTVLFSTHILSDVERICDRVALLNEGRIAVSGDLAALKARHGQNALRVEFADAEDLAQLTLQPAVMPFLANSRQEGTAMIIESRDIAAVQRTLFGALVETRLSPVKVEILEPTLENIFLEVIA